MAWRLIPEGGQPHWSSIRQNLRNKPRHKIDASEAQSRHIVGKVPFLHICKSLLPPLSFPRSDHKYWLTLRFFYRAGFRALEPASALRAHDGSLLAETQTPKCHSSNQIEREAPPQL